MNDLVNYRASGWNTENQYSFYTEYNTRNSEFEEAKQKLENQDKFQKLQRELINMTPSIASAYLALSAGVSSFWEGAAIVAENFLSPVLGYIIPNEPQYPQSMAYEETKNIMNYYNQNSQYKYLINDPNRRESFINLIEEEQKEIMNDSNYSNYEKEIISKMMDDVVYMNKNYTKYNNQMQSQLKKIEDLTCVS